MSPWMIKVYFAVSYNFSESHARHLMKLIMLVCLEIDELIEIWWYNVVRTLVILLLFCVAHEQQSLKQLR